MKLGLLFETLRTLQDLSDHTGTDQNQLHYWNKKSVISWFIDGAFADYTGKITEIDNNKVKMIISMFGNDTVAEVNLNQIAEL